MAFRWGLYTPQSKGCIPYLQLEIKLEINANYIKSPQIFFGRKEMSQIWEFIKENKKARNKKTRMDQESDQEKRKKKENTLSTKKAFNKTVKKKRKFLD